MNRLKYLATNVQRPHSRRRPRTVAAGIDAFYDSVRKEYLVKALSSPNR